MSIRTEWMHDTALECQKIAASQSQHARDLYQLGEYHRAKFYQNEAAQSYNDAHYCYWASTGRIFRG